MEWTGEPAYKQIAAQLRQRIREENLQPGEPLPSLDQIVKGHGVSITVARMAIGMLKAEGLVVVAPGKGNFVAGPAEPKTADFDQVMRQLGVMQQCIERLSGRLADVERQLPPQPDPAAPPTPPTGRQGQR